MPSYRPPEESLVLFLHVEDSLHRWHGGTEQFVPTDDGRPAFATVTDALAHAAGLGYTERLNAPGVVMVKKPMREPRWANDPFDNIA